MNKKIIAVVSLAVIATLFLLWGVGRLLPDEQSGNLISSTIEVLATLLALPVRLYAFFVYGDHGSWSLPVLVLLLATSGLMWGVIVERLFCFFSKRSARQ